MRIIPLYITLVFSVFVNSQENLADQVNALEKSVEQMQHALENEKQKHNEAITKYKQQIQDLKMALRNKAPAKREHWIALQCSAKELATLDGKIDLSRIKAVADQLTACLKEHCPNIDVENMSWEDLQDNNHINKESKKILAKFVERSAWSKSERNWYSEFDFVISRLMLDQLPFGGKWVYIKSHCPTADGKKWQEVKLKLFKRNGLSLDAYPAKDYEVETMNYGDNWAGNAEKKIVRVSGIDAYMKFNQLHDSSKIKGSSENQICLDLFYTGRNGKECKITNKFKPYIIDFQVHHNSFILLRVTGSDESFSKLHQAFRKKITVNIKNGENHFRWKIIPQSGPAFSTYSCSVIPE